MATANTRTREDRRMGLGPMEFLIIGILILILLAIIFRGFRR